MFLFFKKNWNCTILLWFTVFLKWNLSTTVSSAFIRKKISAAVGSSLVCLGLVWGSYCSSEPYFDSHSICWAGKSRSFWPFKLLDREKSLFFGVIKEGREFYHLGMLAENFSNTSRSFHVFILVLKFFMGILIFATKRIYA